MIRRIWLSGNLVLLFASLGVAGEEKKSSSMQESPRLDWEIVLDRLETDRDRILADLKVAHVSLLPRARLEDSSLVARLSPKPPKPRPEGYGILPKIQPDAEEKATVPGKRVYSLESLSILVAKQVDVATDLVRRATEEGAALEPMVTEFEQLRAKVRSIENHLGYHATWQQDVITHPAYFADRNRIHALVLEWREVSERDGGSERAESLRREIGNRLAPFQATPGLVLKVNADGLKILEVKVVTDIEEGIFLEAFRRGVEAAFTESPAATQSKFRIELIVEQVLPEQLYPEEVPKRGAAIVKEDHLGQFPEGALVLTTGAARTHAYVGHYIQLGSEPRTPRSLAHEFGHLIGFSDAYLRAFEKSPNDPFGCVFIEWSGLQDNLMGSPHRGRVTRGMIDQLIKAYGQAAE